MISPDQSEVMRVMGQAQHSNVWKLHGLLRKVISDRSPQFVALFMKELFHLLGIEVASSTTYHPQTDGQTERVNQELEQFLRVFVGERQDDCISKSIKTSACKVAHLSSHKTGLPFQGYGMVVHKFPTTLDGHENLGWSLDACTRIGTT